MNNPYKPYSNPSHPHYYLLINSPDTPSSVLGTGPWTLGFRVYGADWAQHNSQVSSMIASISARYSVLT